MTDDRDDERVRGARELLGWINNIRPTDMTQLFYMHCHNELVLALEDLLDVIDGRPKRDGDDSDPDCGGPATAQ
ncbi:hypothetical protein [Georgenia sp. SUBG003]|uniref:hypothetical protein n=1 Tax=Georgenia sp. SUBG003 TaxID=1497974 RepID=UPI0004D97077|nr:hypothetical protein DA06_16895 [Georgenia sp. SUBG003]